MLNSSQSLYSLLLVLIAVAVALFAYTRWRLREIRATAGTGSLLLGCGSLWILANAFELASRDLNTALRWFCIEHVAMTPIPILWLLLAFQFTGKEALLTRGRFAAMTLVPIVCIAILLSDAFRAQFVAAARLELSDSGANLVVEPGAFMVAYYGYGYVLVIAGAILVSRKLIRSLGFVWQGTIALTGVTLTLLANILDWTQLNPIPFVKLTPLALVTAVVLFIVTLLRARRADIVPIARGSVTQIMSDAVLVLDIEDRIIDLNPAAERMIGQPLARSMGMTLREAFPQWSGKLDDLSLQPGSYSELRLGEGDLEQVYDVRISDLDNRQAQPIGRVLVLRDISERVKAEKAVQLSEEHYRALIENATDLIVIVDETVGIRFASPSVIRTFGYEMSEIVGKCSLDLVHPDDHALVANSLAEAIQTRGASLPVIARYRRADGTWRRLECIINNMLDQPAVRGVVVNARDVTEREAVAEALRQSEEKYRLHFAHINDVIYSFDQRFDIVSMSPSVERILGYKPEEFVGKSVMSLQEKELLAPGYFEKALSEIGQVLNGQRILDARYEFIAKDGALKIAEISASPVFHGDQIVGAVNVGRDVTERVQAEERLRASLQEKEFLLKEIHHRVKNNLQIVSSLLSLQSGTIDDPQIRALFRDSQNRVSSMALIHERLYRSDSLAQIDFGTYLRDLTGHLLQSYRAGDTGVRLVIAADDIHLDIDAAIPCGLVVSELVSNALKHGFPNGRRGTISVEMRNAEDAWYELVVRDDGVGFAPKAGLKPSSSLGLQLISRLTGQLGGRLDYDGTAGTTVTIRFPKDLAHQRSKGTAH